MLLFLLPEDVMAAIVLGTNAGFVTEAPTSDPEGSTQTIDNTALSMKDTSPATANYITEFGWYVDPGAPGDESNYEIGLYSDNAAGEPHLLLEVERTNAKGTSSGWKVVEVLWGVSPNTDYWIAVQLDNTAAFTWANRLLSGGSGLAQKFTQTTLASDWGASGDTEAVGILASYVIWSEFAPDTCTAPGSGDWAIDASDNCVLDTDQDVPGNVHISGTGDIMLTARLTFTAADSIIAIDQGATLDIRSGGELGGT